MEGEESCAGKRKMSFGFSLADDRIKLIDILSEDDNNDDDFLVASPFYDFLKDPFPAVRTDNFAGQGGFRLSGFGNPEETERIQQTEQNLFPSDSLERRRPSFLRRSLAWDNAFYNSAGVLDPDELSFINKGLSTNEVHLLPDTRGKQKQRPEVKSRADWDGNTKWFDIDPFESRRKSAHTSKSTLTKVDGTVRKKKIDRSGRGAISSPKPPLATGRTVNISTGSNRITLPGKSFVKVEDDSAKTGSGKRRAVLEKKLMSHRSSTLSSLHLSPPTISTVVTPTTAMASTVPVPLSKMPIGSSSPRSSSTAFKRKNEPRNCILSASLSTPKIWRGSERSEGMVSTTWPSPASWTSSCSSQSHTSLSTKKKSTVSRTSFGIKGKIRGRSLHSNVKQEESKLQSPFSFSQENRGTSSQKQYSSKAAAQSCSAGSFSVENFRASELRPPSPTIGFFDENTPLSSYEATSRKMSQKISWEGTLLGGKAQFRSLDIEMFPDSSFSSGDTSACKKLEHGIMGRKMIIRPKTPHMHPSLSTESEKDLKSDGKRSRNKLGLNPSLEEEKTRGLVKNKRCKGSREPINDTSIYHAVVKPINKRNEDGRPSLYCSRDQIGNLSKYLEAISLDQDKKMRLGKKQEESPSSCNNNKTETNGAPVSPISKQEKRPTNSPITWSKHSPQSPLLVASVSSIRTPLADKSCISIFNIKSALPTQPKKEKMVETASFYTTLRGNEKEKQRGS